MVHHQRKTATEGLQAAEAELAGLRVTLALAREGEAEQRRRFEQESIKAAALRDELAANEARRTAQEEEISLVRKQVCDIFMFCNQSWRKIAGALVIILTDSARAVTCSGHGGEERYRDDRDLFGIFAALSRPLFCRFLSAPVV